MIAEIHGKISSSGSNLNERLEDNLTGNIFGTLRYLPFNLALGPILMSSILPKTIGDHFKSIHVEYWDDKINFWPFDELGELDALIEFNDLIIGIEVKYQSGLSDGDEKDISDEDEKDISDDTIESQIHEIIDNSARQLKRESKIIANRGQNKRKILLFIAKNSVCKSVYEYAIQHNHIEQGVELGYISWETFHDQLSRLKLDNPFYNLMVSDLVRLLKRKKLNYFSNMHLENIYAIDKNEYFKFNGSVQSKFSFIFDNDIIVKGDLYYEFRRELKKCFNCNV